MAPASYGQEIETWNLLLASTIIQLVLWIGSCQQFCGSDVLQRHRFWRTFCISGFCTFAIIWSATGYLSRLYPDAIIAGHPRSHALSLVMLTHILDALMMITGLHIYRAFTFTIIDRISAISETVKPLQYIKCIFNLVEVFLIITLAICYSFAYIYPHSIPWMHCFYILYGVVMLIQTITMMVVIQKLTNILNDAVVAVDSNHETKIEPARRALNGALIIFIVAVCCLLIYIAMNIVNFYHNVNINAVDSLYDDIIHSVMATVALSLLVLGNYQRSRFCVLYRNSVCRLYCCGEFWLIIASIVCCCCPHCCCHCETERKYRKRKRKQTQNKNLSDLDAHLMVNDSADSCSTTTFNI